MLTLHGYQEIAVEHLQRNPRAALFLDMGLGKTATTLRALTPQHLPALVTAPKRVAQEVWPVEAAKWRPDLKVVLAAGSKEKREAALASDADIVVIGRDNLRNATRFDGKFKTFVLDELSGFKNRSSVRWRAARRLAISADYVWGLTGTPSPNGLIDLWAQIYLLDQGNRLGPTLTAYRSRYFYPGRQLRSGVITEWLLKGGADKKIHEAIEDICLSMSSSDRLDLPPEVHNEISVPLPASVKRIYREMKNTLVADLSDIGAGIHSAANAAVVSNKLSQISAGFLYREEDEGYEILHYEKVRAVQEVVEGTGSPVLVFYRYKAEQEMLLDTLDGARLIDEDGVVGEWNEGKVPVLLAHPASAGHGLNLQFGGSTIVWATLPWSLEEWQQSNARLARQGQTKPVIIHRLISPRSVDGAIYQRLSEKTSVQEALLSHLESPL